MSIQLPIYYQEYKRPSKNFLSFLLLTVLVYLPLNFSAVIRNVLTFAQNLLFSGPIVFLTWTFFFFKVRCCNVIGWWFSPNSYLNNIFTLSIKCNNFDISSTTIGFFSFFNFSSTSKHINAMNPKYLGVNHTSTENTTLYVMTVLSWGLNWGLYIELKCVLWDVTKCLQHNLYLLC